MKQFWKPEILEMAENDIFYVKSGDEHDAENKNWLRGIFGDF